MHYSIHLIPNIVKEYNGLKKRIAVRTSSKTPFVKKNRFINDAYLDTYEKFFSEYFFTTRATTTGVIVAASFSYKVIFTNDI